MLKVNNWQFTQKQYDVVKIITELQVDNDTFELLHLDCSIDLLKDLLRYDVLYTMDFHRDHYPSWPLLPRSEQRTRVPDTNL